MTVRSQGTIEPQIEIDLAAEVSGRVVHVAQSLVSGGRFNAGELLLEIDPENARIELARASARAERAAVEVRRARVALDRLRALESSSVASAAAREDAEFALELAGADHRESLASRARAQRTLDDTRVTAPFSGRVRSVRVDPAQYIAAGESLARIYADGVVEVRLPITERELALLALPPPGTRSDRRGDSLPLVTFSVPSAQGRRSWTGRILRVEAEIDRESRMIHAVARIDALSSPTDDLTPPAVGLFVEAEILARRFEGVYPLPRVALRDGSYVLVVDSRGRVDERRVEVARVGREQALIASGLRAGERVCVSATPPPAGSTVRPLPVEADPAETSNADVDDGQERVGAGPEAGTPS